MAPLLSAIRRLFPPLRVGPKLWTGMALLTFYGLVVAKAIELEHLPDIKWGAESTVLNGIVLGFLISFRNNHAYERWWEARKLWGQLVNESRNLCLKIKTLEAVAPAERDAIGRLVAAFPEALMEHLRRPEGSEKAPLHDDAAAHPGHRPIRLAGELYQVLGRCHRERRIDGWALLWLDGHVKSLMDICGACEKIRNTPIPSSYRALLRHGIAIYLAISPFYLIEDVDAGLVSLPVFILAAYFLLGIELVAEDIEEPFGVGRDNLPLERFCATIRESVVEILGDPPVLAIEEMATVVEPDPSG